MGELGDKLREALAPSLAEGEQLEGSCIATRQSMFKGKTVAIGVTPSRLILQDVDRRWRPEGEPLSLTPERIADASAEGGGGGWANLESALMDSVSVMLKLRTVEGEKLKLRMMRGTGMLGGLGGGEDQSEGVAALAAWFARAEGAA